MTTVVDTCAKAPNRTEPWIEIELKLNEKISTKSFVRQFYVDSFSSCLPPRDTGGTAARVHTKFRGPTYCQVQLGTRDLTYDC